MAVLKLGVTGCAGRMGRALLNAIAADPQSEVAGGTEAPGSDWIGRDIGALLAGADIGLVISDDAGALFDAADVVLDFTAPEATPRHAGAAVAARTPLVIGTTGTSAAEDRAVSEAAKRTAIVRAANMSLGVNLLLGLVDRAARTLGPEFDIEIVDFHHRGKVDAPSGTALALGRAAAVARGQDHDKVAVLSRDGKAGERRRGGIGYAVLRGGTVTGEHNVVFAGSDERVEIVHRAASRDVFARGALRAAHWAHRKAPGLYGMDDVLGLKD